MTSQPPAIRRDILANTAGGSWSALASLAVIPFEIRLLGPESYAVLAFVAAIQTVFSIFDLGLSPTVTREIAGDRSPDLRETCSLVEALWLPYTLIGVGAGILLFVGAKWLASDWLNLHVLTTASVTLALRLSALAIALRWPVSFYSGVLAGRRNFRLLNSLKAANATFNSVGIVVVVLVMRSLIAVTIWMVLSALVEAFSYALACWRNVPSMNVVPGDAISTMKRIWRFSSGMNAINLLSIALTQSDRAVVSRLLPAEALGYYSLAYNVVLGLTLLQGFVTSAVFPTFSADHKAGNHERLALRYAKASQALVAVYMLPSGLLIFFGRDLLQAVTTPQAAIAAAPVLVLLAIGFLLNASMSVPYTLAVAAGQIRIPVVINAASLVMYMPILFFAVHTWNITGAAIAWLALNASYLATLLPLVQIKVARRSTFDWITKVFLPFPLAGIVTLGLARLILFVTGWTPPAAIALVAASGGIAYAALAFRLLDASLRAEIETYVRPLFGVFRSVFA